jgi:mannan endo-1,4-beta-mannosidase
MRHLQPTFVSLLLAALGLLLPLAARAQTEVRPLRERVAFGAYTPGLPYFPERLREIEGPERLGRRLEIVSGFVDFEYVLGEKRDRFLAAGGKRTLLYSWEPHCEGEYGCIAFRDITSGKLDPYLSRVAASVKRFGQVIYVRPWAEMNAGWSPYKPGSTGPLAGTVDEFKAAWRYLYSFFKQRKVKNLRFVFNTDSAIDSDHVELSTIWPGAEYIDVLGIDGYNWGYSGVPNRNTWLEFDEVFASMYASMTALHPTAPVWICEFGSKEPEKSDGSAGSPAPADPDHSKASWIENAMTSSAFPRLEALVYYDAYTPDRDNQRDFRFVSSPGALAMIRQQLALRARVSRARTARPSRAPADSSGAREPAAGSARAPDRDPGQHGSPPPRAGS